MPDAREPGEEKPEGYEGVALISFDWTDASERQQPSLEDQKFQHCHELAQLALRGARPTPLLVRLSRDLRLEHGDARLQLVNALLELAYVRSATPR